MITYDRFVVDGKIWYAGDDVYINTEEVDITGLPTEVCLNDFLKDHVKENSNVTIIIDVEVK